MERKYGDILSSKQKEKAERDLVIIHALALRDGWLPDIRLMAENFGLNTTSAVGPRLDKLVLLGWLRREDDSSRKMMITDKGREVIGEAILKLVKK